jgi:hypothetical protein
MAYEEVTQDSTTSSPSGTVRLTASLNKPLAVGTRQVLRRTCSRFEGDTSRTPFIIEAEEVANPAVFVSYGTTLFGDSLQDFDEATEVVFTPLIVDADDNVVYEGVPFTITLEYVAPTLNTDLPTTAGLYRLWDTRSTLDLGLREWKDVKYGDAIVFQDDASGNLMAIHSPPSYTRFKFNALRISNSTFNLDFTQVPAAGLLDLDMPPKWTMLILGYTEQNYPSIVNNTEIYDAAFGYSTSDEFGPFEGAYRYLTEGVVVSSQMIPVPGTTNLRLNHFVAITSDTTAPLVSAYTDVTAVTPPVATNTAPYGRLTKFFPLNDNTMTEFQIGQIVIYDRILSAGEISAYNQYALDVWYKTEV